MKHLVALRFRIASLTFVMFVFRSLQDINPASSKEGRTSTCEMNFTEWSSRYSQDRRVSEPFGHFDRSMQMKAERDTDLYNYMLSYKYLIIIGGISSADRLNTFLAHSGAVIMLQETDFHYHFTAFLKPWVHYGAFDCGSIEKHLTAPTSPFV